MPDKVRLLGISGSLRRASYNSSLLQAAKSLANPDAVIEIASLRDIPLYNADVEAEGFPQAVQELRRRILDCDGLLIATPEYNNSMPGVLKNAVDWVSRPFPDKLAAFRDKPVAVIGASPGGFGTVLAQNAWLPVFKTLGMRQFSGSRLLVSRVHQAIGENGEITDQAITDQLRAFIEAYVGYVKAIDKQPQLS